MYVCIATLYVPVYTYVEILLTMHFSHHAMERYVYVYIQE